MPLRFKAAVLRQAGLPEPYESSRPLRLEEVSVEGPREGELLVRIGAASLCRSDLSVVNGRRAWPLPIVPGHEASGVVEENGPGVTRVKRGDAVVLVFQPQCGHCPNCIGGDAHLCGPGLQANRAGELLGGGTRLRCDGASLHHHMGLSAFAEYAVVSEASVVPVPAGIPLDIAALFGCGVMCGAGSVLNTAQLRAGDSITIVGAGGVGCSALLGARLAGAGRIVVIDTDAGRLDTARQLGATDLVHDHDGNAAAQVADLTDGGTDHALETAGTLEAFRTAYQSVRRGGQVVTVGLVDPRTPFSLDVAALVTSAKTLRGSYIGSCNPQRDIPRYMSLFQRGLLPVDRLISHRMALAEVNTALDRMANNRALRQILQP
jgi:alcohol dehydrogenase